MAKRHVEGETVCSGASPALCAWHKALDGQSQNGNYYYYCAANIQVQQAVLICLVANGGRELKLGNLLLGVGCGQVRRQEHRAGEDATFFPWHRGWRQGPGPLVPAVPPHHA